MTTALWGLNELCACWGIGSVVKICGAGALPMKGPKVPYAGAGETNAGPGEPPTRGSVVSHGIGCMLLLGDMTIVGCIGAGEPSILGEGGDWPWPMSVRPPCREETGRQTFSGRSRVVRFVAGGPGVSLAFSRASRHTRCIHFCAACFPRFGVKWGNTGRVSMPTCMSSFLSPWSSFFQKTWPRRFHGPQGPKCTEVPKSSNQQVVSPAVWINT